jgi:hypothetical protein
MKYILILILLSLNTVIGCAQTRYSFEHYWGAIEDFYIAKDSTCYLKKHIASNTFYQLYKGKLTKINDTLYTFKFRPVVDFSAFLKFDKGDTISTSYSNYDTITMISKFSIRSALIKNTSIKLTEGWHKNYLKDASIADFEIITNFIDPQTNQVVPLFIDKTSCFSLSFYSSKTPFQEATVTIVKNKLNIYANQNKIENQLTLTQVE